MIDRREALDVLEHKRYEYRGELFATHMVAVSHPGLPHHREMEFLRVDVTEEMLSHVK